MQTLSEWRTEERADGTWLGCQPGRTRFRIEDNGTTSGAFLAVCAPRGIVGGMPALARGLLGFPSHWCCRASVELAEDDPTPRRPALIS